MQQLDIILDENPTAEAVANMAETRIRNLQCFRELESLNNYGKFIGNHPLLQDYSERKKYKNLYVSSKEDFLSEFSKIDGYIKRYNSYLNNKKADKRKRDNWQKHLHKYQSLKQIFIEIMEMER